MASFFLAASLTQQRADLFNYHTLRPARLLLAAYDRGDEPRSVRDFYTPSSLLPEDLTTQQAVFAVTSLFDSLSVSVAPTTHNASDATQDHTIDNAEATNSTNSTDPDTSPTASSEHDTTGIDVTA